MKQIDFDHGTVTGNILGAALPMLVAQILSLLYNIVDRIYIARIPSVGTTALGAVGLCFPIIVIITAFSNLFGSGGAPLFSINRGKGNNATTAAIYVLAGLRIVLCMMPQNEWLSAEERNDQSFRWMWLTIALSFAFYIPVALWADVVPMIGMLMIPKTCAYVWTVLIGYKAMKKEIA